MPMCLRELATATGGQLRLASMPPRDGELTLVRRFCLRPELAAADDVVFCLQSHDGSLELAYLRGALGVVSARPIEPWPGRFSLLVPGVALALKRLLNEGLLPQLSGANPALCPATRSGRESRDKSPELKGLQLWAGAGVDIYSPTCGRERMQRDVHGDRRRAA